VSVTIWLVELSTQYFSPTGSTAPVVRPVISFDMLIESPTIVIFVAKIHIKMKSKEMKPYMANDFLKYWRVIRRYCLEKYGLSTEDLDVLLFIKSEGLFNTRRWKEYKKIISWEKHRLERLVADGWIDQHRKHHKTTSSLYRISMKGLRVTMSIYSKLNGEEMPTSPSTNPIFLKKVGFMTKQYREAILNMNNWTKEQRRRRAPE
jgi:hypothetical protein